RRSRSWPGHAGGVESLQAVVAPVRYVDIVRRIYRHTPGHVELTDTAAEGAPLGHKATLWIELLQAMIAGIRHNDVPRRVERQAGGAVEAAVLSAGSAPTVEQRSILGEALHIVAPFVTNQEPALGIADHGVGPDELAGSSAVCAPLAKVVLVQSHDTDAQPADRRVKNIRGTEDERAPVCGRRH